MERLPNEVLVEIFSFLEAYELLRLERVCSRWKALIGEFFWRGKDGVHRLLVDVWLPDLVRMDNLANVLLRSQRQIEYFTFPDLSAVGGKLALDMENGMRVVKTLLKLERALKEQLAKGRLPVTIDAVCFLERMKHLHEAVSIKQFCSFSLVDVVQRCFSTEKLSRVSEDAYLRGCRRVIMKHVNVCEQTFCMKITVQLLQRGLLPQVEEILIEDLTVMAGRCHRTQVPTWESPVDFILCLRSLPKSARVIIMFLSLYIRSCGVVMKFALREKPFLVEDFLALFQELVSFKDTPEHVNNVQIHLTELNDQRVIYYTRISTIQKSCSGHLLKAALSQSKGSSYPAPLIAVPLLRQFFASSTQFLSVVEGLDGMEGLLGTLYNRGILSKLFMLAVVVQEDKLCDGDPVYVWNWLTKDDCLTACKYLRIHFGGLTAAQSRINSILPPSLSTLPWLQKLEVNGPLHIGHFLHLLRRATHLRSLLLRIPLDNARFEERFAWMARLLAGIGETKTLVSLEVTFYASPCHAAAIRWLEPLLNIPENGKVSLTDGIITALTNLRLLNFLSIDFNLRAFHTSIDSESFKRALVRIRSLLPDLRFIDLRDMAVTTEETTLFDAALMKLLEESVSPSRTPMFPVCSG